MSRESKMKAATIIAIYISYSITVFTLTVLSPMGIEKAFACTIILPLLPMSLAIKEKSLNLGYYPEVGWLVYLLFRLVF
jgi:hypothetical protein